MHVSDTATTSRPVPCSSCNLREMCLAVGLSQEDMARLDDVISQRRQVLRGSTSLT